jgi:hypothetical protein
MPSWRDYSQGRQDKIQNQAYSDVNRDANMYLTALQKAAYGNAADQYGGGLDQITNYLAGAGPLAYSGAKLALRKRLYSQIYGQARNQIGASYADYLRQALQAQRNYRYQLALMKAQRDAQSTGLGGVFGGVAGAFGGPFLSAIGSEVGGRIIK